MCRYKTLTKPIEDRCVIYFSENDKCWIAHSLYTDQIGTGECMLDALVEIMTVVDALFMVSQEQKDVRVWRKAPLKILNLAKKAAILPEELYEIAHKRARGLWPNELRVTISQPMQPYSAKLPAMAAC
jgi:hypothetical protein